MIAVDTSAIIAILFQEEDAQRFAEAIGGVQNPLISAVSVVEASIVLSVKKSSSAERLLNQFLDEAGLTLEPVTAEHARLAREGWRKYGKGRHPAGLNFGDCFAYALAKASNAPLLFKGDDFKRTDIRSVL